MCLFVFFFFKQKTAYEMRISDWSSDVCSSDLVRKLAELPRKVAGNVAAGIEPIVLGGARRHGGRGLRLGRRGRGQDQQCRGGEDGKRSEGGRVGKEGVSTGRSRWSPEH